MAAEDLLALLPFLILASAVVAGLVLLTCYRDHELMTAWCTAALLVAVLASHYAAAFVPRQVTPLLYVNRFTLFYAALLSLAGAAVALLCHGYMRGEERRPEECYLLLLLATLGAALLVSSSHLASLLLSLEILSVALYGMIGYLRTAQRGIEAALKYLVLAAASSAFLLFGIALIYAQAGSLYLPGLAALATTRGGWDPVMLAGFGLVLVGLGFKLAVVPFHLWTPDVYQGAPSPVAAFVATISKGAVVALLLRYFDALDGARQPALLLVLSLLAAASMLVGNLLALLQSNLKRLLAYSSIAHLGYVLVALVEGGELGRAAVTYYLIAYITTMLAAFGVIAALSSPRHETEHLAQYRGLYRRHPWLAGLLTMSLLSLAGLPVTAGFVGKFYVVTTGVAARHWWLLAALVVGSAIGLFYYARVILVMSAPPEGERAAGPAPAASLPAAVTLGVLGGLLVWLGAFPGPLQQLIRQIVLELF